MAHVTQKTNKSGKTVVDVVVVVGGGGDGCGGGVILVAVSEAAPF